MKKILALCLALVSIQLLAQTKKEYQINLASAQKEAAIINDLLATLADVSPFYSPEEVKEFIADYEKFSPEGDVWEIIDSCNSGIAIKLESLLTNKKYAELSVETMVETNKTYSPDSSIIIHNWYTNNGGTFMMFMNFAQVKLNNGKSQFIELDYAGSIYETGFVPDQNFQSYYFVGSTKGCSSCYDYTVMLYSITENGLEPLTILENVNAERDYAFSIYFRGWDFENNYISFNEIDHAFEYSNKNDDAYPDEIFFEEGRWIFDGNLFRQEVSIQLDQIEFENLNGASDNN